jgi:hypothetical protein
VLYNCRGYGGAWLLPCLPLKNLTNSISRSHDVVVLLQKFTGNLPMYRNIYFEKERGWAKFIAVPGLILTSGVSLFLLFSQHRTYSNGLYQAVSGSRATVQIIVQLLSYALGICQIYTLSTLINFYGRIELSERGTTLSRLSLWKSLSLLYVDWTIPIPLLLPLLAFLGLSVLPSALWAGAITPVVTTSERAAFIGLPVYTPDPSGIYWNRTWGPFYQDVSRTSLGTFSFTPAYPLGGLLLDSAAAATPRNSSVRQFQKLDTSRHSYNGRSFGAGSSVGMQNVTEMPYSKTAAGTLPDIAAQSYSYVETGYNSNVTCIYNKTASWAIQLGDTSNDGAFPNSYLASGALPNSNYIPHESGGPWLVERFAGVGLRDDSQVVALVGLTNHGRNFFAIAAGQTPGNYTVLNRTQCEVVFTPSQFRVSVDTTARLINVTLQSSTAVDMDPTSVKGKLGLSVIAQDGIIAQNVMRSPTLLSMINTSLYTSVLGNMLISNVNNAQAAQAAGFIPKGLNNDSVALLAIEQSLESLIDDTLLAFSSAQLWHLMQTNTAKSVDVEAQVNAVRIGKEIYIIITAAINFLVVFIFAEEAIRTKGWQKLQRFDYRNLRSVVDASTIGMS